MKALCWQGVNRLSVERVPDPELLSPGDAIIRVHLSSVCGSDLHLLDGYVPSMRAGDIIGHEFLGEVLEVGAEVEHLQPGQRVVVCSIIGCGDCYYCKHDAWSLCDNSNPKPHLLEEAYGHAGAGIFGYSHGFGGYAGSHAELIRVPYADHNCFPVPEGLSDEAALFCSDALPTGYMAADLAHIEGGDVVAVWGCGGVGLMAIRSAYLLGAEQVIAIDRYPERLALARHYGATTLDYTEVDVLGELAEMTGGRGPDSCLDCVGMEAHSPGLDYAYDRTKQFLRLQTGRPTVLRQAFLACRKGGTVSIVGVYGGFLDKFPLGAAMNKGLTLRMGQQHGQRYIPRLLEDVAAGKIDTARLLTHRLSLEDGVAGYGIFKYKRDGCIRTVFDPRLALT